MTNETTNFCETVASVMGLSPANMSEFKVLQEKDRSGNGRVLKAKFTVIFSKIMNVLIDE